MRRFLPTTAVFCLFYFNCMLLPAQKFTELSVPDREFEGQLNSANGKDLFFLFSKGRTPFGDPGEDIQIYGYDGESLSLINIPEGMSFRGGFNFASEEPDAKTFVRVGSSNLDTKIAYIDGDSLVIVPKEGGECLQIIGDDSRGNTFFTCDWSLTGKDFSIYQFDGEEMTLVLPTGAEKTDWDFLRNGPYFFYENEEGEAIMPFYSDSLGNQLYKLSDGNWQRFGPEEDSMVFVALIHQGEQELYLHYRKIYGGYSVYKLDNEGLTLLARDMNFSIKRWLYEDRNGNVYFQGRPPFSGLGVAVFQYDGEAFNQIAFPSNWEYNGFLYAAKSGIGYFKFSQGLLRFQEDDGYREKLFYLSDGEIRAFDEPASEGYHFETLGVDQQGKYYLDVESTFICYTCPPFKEVFSIEGDQFKKVQQDIIPDAKYIAQFRFPKANDFYWIFADTTDWIENQVILEFDGNRFQEMPVPSNYDRMLTQIEVEQLGKNYWQFERYDSIGFTVESTLFEYDGESLVALAAPNRDFLQNILFVSEDGEIYLRYTKNDGSGIDYFPGFNVLYKLSPLGTSIGHKATSHPYISIYPNPSKDKLFFSVEIPTQSPQPAFIEIIDLQGNSLYAEQQLIRSNGEIQLNDFAAGMYILKIQFDHGQFTKKFLISE